MPTSIGCHFEPIPAVTTAAIHAVSSCSTVGREYPEHWPKPKDGWTLTIEGDPSMRAHFLSLASFTRPASIEEHVRSANVATALQVLNAVPAICEAPPGFATMASLPLIRSQTGFGAH
jgi:2,4-diaminopentanoate dehydrogenase